NSYSFPTRRSSDLLILKSGVNHTSRGSISTSTLPSIKLRKCSSKIITSILSFISGTLATKSNQIKQLIRNGRSASLQRTFKKSLDRKSGSAGMPRPISYAVFCLKKKKQGATAGDLTFAQLNGSAILHTHS